MIHIAYAEDHDLLRSVIAGLLHERGFDVATFKNGKELTQYLHAAIGRLPDICMVNVYMPKKDGFETTRYIRKHFASLKVLAYSMSDYDTDIIRMLQAGAMGYVIKDGDIDTLIRAIESILRRGFYFDETTGKTILNYIRKE